MSDPVIQLLNCTQGYSLCPPCTLCTDTYGDTNKADFHWSSPGGNTPEENVSEGCKNIGEASPVIIASKSFTNPYDKPATVTICGGVDDAIHLNGDSKSIDGIYSAHLVSVQIRVEAKETFTLGYSNDVGACTEIFIYIYIKPDDKN